MANKVTESERKKGGGGHCTQLHFFLHLTGSLVNGWALQRFMHVMTSYYCPAAGYVRFSVLIGNCVLADVFIKMYACTELEEGEEEAATGQHRGSRPGAV